MSISPPRTPLLSPRPRPWASTSRALDEDDTDSPRTVERMLGAEEGTVWKGDGSEEEDGEAGTDGSPRPRRVSAEEDRGVSAWSGSPPPRPTSTHERDQPQRPAESPEETLYDADPLHRTASPLERSSSDAERVEQETQQQERVPKADTPSPPSSPPALGPDHASPNSTAAQQLLDTLARMSYDPSAIDTSPISGDVPSGGLRRGRGTTMTTLEERTEEGSSEGQHQRMLSVDKEERGSRSRRSRSDGEGERGLASPPSAPSVASAHTRSATLHVLPHQVALPSSRPSSGVFSDAANTLPSRLPPSSYPLPASLSSSSLATRPTSSPVPPHFPISVTHTPTRSASDLIALFERQKQDRLTPTPTSPARASYLAALPSPPKSPLRKSAFDISQFGTAATSARAAFRPTLASPPRERPAAKDAGSDETASPVENLMPTPLAPLPPPQRPSSRSRTSPLQKVAALFSSSGGARSWEAAPFAKRAGGGSGLSIIRRAKAGLRARSGSASKATDEPADGRLGREVREMRDATGEHGGTFRLRSGSLTRDAQAEACQVEREAEEGDDSDGRDGDGEEQVEELEQVSTELLLFSRAFLALMTPFCCSQPVRTGHLW